MKTFFKILGATIGVVFCLIVIVGASVSAISHAKVYGVTHGTKQDTSKMIIQHESMSKPSPNPVGGQTP